MNDKFNRKIDYLRISITDFCNLRCKYCMPADGVNKKSHFEIISFEEIEQLTKAAKKLGIKKIRITGGEPLVRRGIVSLIKMIKDTAPNIELVMTTNAILLNKYAPDLKQAGLDRVNISLDTLDAGKYYDITRGGNLDDAIQGIEAAREADLSPIKINMVLIKDFNDDEIENFIYMTQHQDIELRFIELMPFGQNAFDYFEGKFISTNVILKRMPTLIKQPEDASGVCSYYKLPNSLGRVGFITPHSNKFCHRCNRIRVTADAKIKPCLHSNDEIDIRDQLKAGFSYEQILSDAILCKPATHKLDEQQYISRDMNRIGG